jgi:hypothetical protein
MRRVLVSGSDRQDWLHLIDRGPVQVALAKPFAAAELIAVVEDCAQRGERE